MFKIYFCGIVAMIILLTNIVILIHAYIKLPKRIRTLYAGRSIISKEERYHIFRTSFNRYLLPAIITELLSFPISGGLIALGFGGNFTIEGDFSDIFFPSTLVILPIAFFFTILYDSYLSMRYYVCDSDPKYLRDVSMSAIYCISVALIMFLSWVTVGIFVKAFWFS